MVLRKLKPFAVIKTNAAGALNNWVFAEGFISRVTSLGLFLLRDSRNTRLSLCFVSGRCGPCTWAAGELNLWVFQAMLKCNVKDEPVLSFSGFVANMRIKDLSASSVSPVRCSASKPGAQAGPSLALFHPKFPQGQGLVATVPPNEESGDLRREQG